LLISYILNEANVLNSQLFIALLLLGAVIPLVVWDHFRGHHGFLKRKEGGTVSIYPVFYGYPAFGITPLVIIVFIASVQFFPPAFAVIFVGVVSLFLILAFKFVFIQSTPKITVKGKVFPLWFMYSDWQSMAEIYVSETDITEIKGSIFRPQTSY
jgi:hypothetical protein